MGRTAIIADCVLHIITLDHSNVEWNIILPRGLVSGACPWECSYRWSIAAGGTVEGSTDDHGRHAVDPGTLKMWCIRMCLSPPTNTEIMNENMIIEG